MLQQITNLIPPLAFIICVLLHAVEEFKKGLALYLETILGFTAGKWLDYILFLLAVLIIFFPFILVIMGILPENVAKSFVVGALIGDAVSTHWAPSIKWRWSPGSLSALLYPYMAFLLYQSTQDFVLPAAAAGTATFVSLWPVLRYVVKPIVQFFQDKDGFVQED